LVFGKTNDGVLKHNSLYLGTAIWWVTEPHSMCILGLLFCPGMGADTESFGYFHLFSLTFTAEHLHIPMF
jgi:hypothetical protein